MSKDKVKQIVEEVVRIYFEQNCSAKDAIDKAKAKHEGAK